MQKSMHESMNIILDLVLPAGVTDRVIFLAGKSSNWISVCMDI
jgi:hypothetical protein